MECSVKPEKPVISGRITDSGGSHGPVRRAEVRLSVLIPELARDKEKEGPKEAAARDKAAADRFQLKDKVLSDDDGRFRFLRDLESGVTYRVECQAFGHNPYKNVTIEPGAEHHVPLTINLDLKLATLSCPEDGRTAEPISRGKVGRLTLVRLESRLRDQLANHEMVGGLGSAVVHLPDHEAEFSFTRAGMVRVEAWVTDRNTNSFGENAQAHTFMDFGVANADVNMVSGRLGVALERTAVHHTQDQALWVAIRNRTRAISFGPYRDFINRVLHAEEHETLGIPALDRRLQELGAHMHGVGAFQLLKTATEVFLLMECGVSIRGGRDGNRLFSREDESGRLRLEEPVSLDFISAKLKEYLGCPPQLPYITRVVEASFPEIERGDFRSDRVLTCRINEPCLLELIWCYWHEEGMLVQTMNAINRRFQNVRAPGDRDPLAHFELDPLRRVGNILWGQIQDELNLLPVKRRAYEYSHQYGFSLYGRATGAMRPADNRSKFLEAFHNLLHLTSVFYKEDNDTTIISDGFPLLNALKEVHLMLAQGAHNQFGDLPWTARAEMMLQEWILSRPEIREFLQSRHMVPYKEAWMPQVDTMKTLQGWSDVTVTHFRDLGVYGEQILLSVRYGDWIDIVDEDSAKNWARYWRAEIQGYLHGYRAVTGVDLTNPDTVDATVPAIHLQKRLSVQQRVR